MFDDIKADVLRYHRRGTAPRAIDCLRLAIENFGLQALFVYRLGRWLRNRPVTLLLYPVYQVLAAGIRLAYGINLEQSAEIGPGLYIGHFGAIHVAHCRMGARCAIQQHVRLDAGSGTKGPVIGTAVWIGAHAQIRADVEIGDGATIGAGAVVTQDVPPRCLVLGNPGRVTQRDYDNSMFL